MYPEKTMLPEKIDDWTRSETARPVDADNIFEYMNGAGELYLGYGFNDLIVWEYSTGKDDTILVEIYTMNTSADAFGLLSLDWSGEPVSLSDTKTKRTGRPRALYGGGLLRVWAGSVYARIMAFYESDKSKEIVLALGRIIATGKGLPDEPDLMHRLPGEIESGWRLRTDRMGFFRSHLVLNSLYYLSHKNILLLDHSTEAVTAPYDRRSVDGPDQRVQTLLIHYASPQHAKDALISFHTAYLPEKNIEDVKPVFDDSASHSFKIENGWLGYTLAEDCLSIVFDAPDRASAGLILKHIDCN